MAALSVFAMLFVVLLFFKEPRRTDDAPADSLGQVGKNFLTVLSNPRFMVFLLIFTGYWIVFWQEFIALPLYISAYIDPKADTEKILMTDPLVVIFLTMVIGFLTKRMHAFHAIVLGTLVSSLAWILLIVHPSVWMAVATLVVVAIGEIIQHRGTTTTSRASRRRSSRARIWDSPFSLWALDRSPPENSADG